MARKRQGGSRYDLRKRERFIELRAKGWSYSRIAKAIGVSKPTLLKWNDEFHQQIVELRSIHMDRLRDKYQLLARYRLKSYGREIQKIQRELGKRDYANVSTERLPDLLVKLYTSLRKEDLFAKEQETVERQPETWFDMVMRSMKDQKLTTS